jgi:hypothetical protein
MATTIFTGRPLCAIPSENLAFLRYSTHTGTWAVTGSASNLVADR